MEQQILGWITQYGYSAIFALLMFGIVGLPVPDETLLTFTGFLVLQGPSGSPCWRSARRLAGSACGITLSYIARAHLRHAADPPLRPLCADHRRARQQGARLVRARGTLGADVRLFHSRRPPPHRVCRRHERGGAPQFALFAYSGGVLWVVRFLSLGYFLGERWEAVEKNIHHYLVWLTVAGAIALAAYLVWRKAAAGER